MSLIDIQIPSGDLFLCTPGWVNLYFFFFFYAMPAQPETNFILLTKQFVLFLETCCLLQQLYFTIKDQTWQIDEGLLIIQRCECLFIYSFI